MLRAVLLFLLLFFGQGWLAAVRTEKLGYSTFLAGIGARAHQVRSVEVGTNGQINGAKFP